VADEHLILVRLILNPWNAVLGFCVWAGLQTLKSLIAAFRDGGSLHHTLRFAAVVACTAIYFVPGPWTDGEDLSAGMKVILGIITGTVTTLLHGMTSDFRKFITRFFRKRAKEGNAQDAAKDFDTLIASAKKAGWVVTAIGTGFSGLYGAWLKPTDTTKAKAAYEVTEEGIEELSVDIEEIDEDLNGLIEAHNELDKQTAIEIAMLKKQLEDVQDELKRSRRSYEPARVAVTSEDLSMASQVEVSHEEIAFAPEEDGPPTDSVMEQLKIRIKRDGKKLDLPAAKDLFR
jgi:hypothetical protein